MKIKKFNESIQNWSEERLKKMGEEKSYLALLIRDYLIFNNIYDDEINN